MTDISRAPVSSAVEAVRWVGDATAGHLELLDQRKLPAVEELVACSTAEATAAAIRAMVVRGAPAIGLAAAYGMVLAAQEVGAVVRPDSLEHAFTVLADARPTAVNLRWALERMRAVLEAAATAATAADLLAEAERIRCEDVAANAKMGEHGARLLVEGARVLTYCNTGSLATAGQGTALGVIRTAWASGRLREVFACETRPYLQGARLTMWELLKDGIPATLITDNMAGYLMRLGRVDAALVGADRIAANGDTANKIGTYTVAVLAHHHRIPFYVVAPTSTIDLETPSGAGIPIEERDPAEVVQVLDRRIAPEGAAALHPAFDVTPADLVTAIVTEAGVARAPYVESLRRYRA